MIVQNYNSVLTLAHLHRLSDAILVHENDTVHRICGQLLNIKNISFADVNRVIAQQLAGVLQPALTADSYGVYGRNPLGEGLKMFPAGAKTSFKAVQTLKNLCVHQASS